MVFSITKGIKVSVKTEYQSFYSNPQQNHFVFSYKVAIENNSEHTIQLLRRHWHIVDANGFRREVEGEGVVGYQPTLEPGHRHEYVSGCNLNTQIGKMYGAFQMIRVLDGEIFEVEIPEFLMEVPYLLN